MNTNKILLSGIAAVSIAVGIGAGWLLKESSQAAPAAQPGPTNAVAAMKEEKKALFYRHPMNPSITSPTPRKDEMGMDYIPVYTEEEKRPRPPAWCRSTRAWCRTSARAPPP